MLFIEHILSEGCTDASDHLGEGDGHGCPPSDEARGRMGYVFGVDCVVLNFFGKFFHFECELLRLDLGGG